VEHLAHLVQLLPDARQERVAVVAVRTASSSLVLVLVPACSWVWARRWLRVVWMPRLLELPLGWTAPERGGLRA